MGKHICGSCSSLLSVLLFTSLHAGISWLLSPALLCLLASCHLDVLHAARQVTQRGVDRQWGRDVTYCLYLN